jgi:Ca-activated chloride channel family protein
VLEFAQPWALALLVLPVLVLRLAPAHRERAPALRVPFFQELIAAAGIEARSGAIIRRKTSLQRATLILAWLLLVAALAEPQWVGEPIERSESSRDVMLAIDLSGSMDYADFPGADGSPVSRFAAVQRVVDDFVAARDGDRVGLIVFGSRAYLQLPFTRDLVTASALVDLMAVGMAGPKTALGDAIGLAIHAFEESRVEQRLLILLTDGNDTASRMTPINAAEVARLNGVEVYTIGVGDPDASGEDRVDFAVLEAVAGRTGGQFFTAGDESALAGVYRRIDALSPGEVRTQSWRPRESLLHWPAGAAALLVLLFHGGHRVSRSRRRMAS